MYEGKTEEATEYFASNGFSLPPNTNPADYFMDVIAAQAQHSADAASAQPNLCEIWASRHQTQSRMSDSSIPSIDQETIMVGDDVKVNRRLPGFLAQLKMFWWRASVQRVRFKTTLMLDFLLVIVRHHLLASWVMNASFGVAYTFSLILQTM